MTNPKKLFPMIVTDKLKETKKFYLEQAGFELSIEMEGYLQVRAGSEAADPEIAFMAPGAMPDGAEFKKFGGDGVVISVPTRSADEKAEALRAAGLSGFSDPTDKPRGWRSFLVADPSGVLLDFFHVVGPSPLLGQA